jgi:hypothetical protein
MRNGTCWERATSALHTDASASSSAPGGPNSEGLWPTPTTDTADRQNRYAQGGMPLSVAARMWPTPTTPNGGRTLPPGTSRTGMTPNGVKRQVDLRQAVRMQQWPTPTSEDSEQPGARKSGWLGLTQSARQWPTATAMDSKQSVASHPETNVTLTDAARRGWPTPRASDYKGSGPLGSKSQQHKLDRGYLDATAIEADKVSGPLNPDWVEWLMGLPIGWTDPDQSEPLEHPGWETDPADADIAREWPTPAASEVSQSTDLQKSGDGRSRPNKLGWAVAATPRSTHAGMPRIKRGVKDYAHRLKAIGNAVVPQCGYVAAMSLLRKP